MPRVTVLPIARTRDEALAYLDLLPCAECGSVQAEWQHGLAQVGGRLVTAYDGTCGKCGTGREHLFGLPDREHAGGTPNFGGPEPSQLLDPGQWLDLADRLMSAVPSDDPAAADEAARYAVAAVREVLKFLSPGTNTVPPELFWSDAGRRVYDQQPGRFRLDRLQVVLATYENLDRPGLRRR
ncbi:hypothetical protein [Kribbella sp. CA-293567]|uniref:hypothetical protein n=1 Tax=Kribbella sp. CA-293567 TaxID=3002436 RepID=UPI0022DD9771|nr:hypothetical protein [Kribbella sp. CA-293567]WBQ08444.1 hypothetical protein OX958_16890 [Kribbella sp. CA-293567]